MRKNRGIIVGKGCETIMKLISVLSLTAKAEEVEKQEDDKTPIDGEEPKTPSINYEDLIAKARKEEKEKQYNVIKKLKGQIDTLTEQHNNDLLVNAELEKKLDTAEEKLTKVGSGDSEELKTLKGDYATLKKTCEDLEKKVASYESQTPVSREEIEVEVRKELEAEYEVKTYKAEKLAELKDKILVPELIIGDTKEEIDQSIEVALNRSEEIRKSLGITESQKTQKRTPKTPSNPSISGVQNKGIDLDKLATMDVASPEYAEMRKQLGLK